MIAVKGRLKFFYMTFNLKTVNLCVYSEFITGCECVVCMCVYMCVCVCVCTCVCSISDFLIYIF